MVSEPSRSCLPKSVYGYRIAFVRWLPVSRMAPSLSRPLWHTDGAVAYLTATPGPFPRIRTVASLEEVTWVEIFSGKFCRAGREYVSDDRASRRPDLLRQRPNGLLSGQNEK